jgi:hypothetical protein
LPEPDQTAAVVFDEINGDEFSTPGKATSIDVVLPANSYSGATKRQFRECQFPAQPRGV